MNDARACCGRKDGWSAVRRKGLAVTRVEPDVKPHLFKKRREASMRNLAVAAVLLIALASCKTTEQELKESGFKPLSAASIEKMLADNTIEGTSAQGRPFIAYYKSDGTIHLKSLTRNKSFKGTWRVVAPDKYCRTYPARGDGQEECRRWYKTRDGYRLVKSDGSHSSDVKVLTGNPRQL